MAKQPEFPIPFRPFASARLPQDPTIVRDDTRQWFSDLPGQVFSDEVLVPATGTWQTILNAPPAPLTEVMRLRLPRPEPITLTIHPWTNTVDRFRAPIRLYANTAPIPGGTLEPFMGRIFIEWGSGKSRMWTYIDAAQAAFQLPTVSDVRVSAWSSNVPFILSATAQVGYAHSELFGTWTVAYHDNVIGGVEYTMPQFARSVTGFFYGADLNDTAELILRTDAGLIMHKWLMRPAITPNPRVIPYAPVEVPLSGAATGIRVALTNTLGGNDVVAAVVKVRI